MSDNFSTTSNNVFLNMNEHYIQWLDIDWSKLKNLNRYPDNNCKDLVLKLVEKYSTKFIPEEVIFGVGSLDIIEMIFKTFLKPEDKIMTIEPCFEIYEFYANLNNNKCKKVLFSDDLTLDIQNIKKNIEDIKVLFISNPNNPTGHLISKDQIREILKFYKGILVIDEAYIEFGGMENSMEDLVHEYKNIIISRSFSKAWGIAGIRLGYGISNKENIDKILKIKSPYSVSTPSQIIGIQALENIDSMKKYVNHIKTVKLDLENELINSNFSILPTNTNFSLIKINDPLMVYNKLIENNIYVANRSHVPLLSGVLRITIGSPEENMKLVECLKMLK